MMKILFSALLLSCCALTAAAEDWGTITGQIVVTGEIPEPVLLHAKNAEIKDKEVCAVVDTYAEDLLIDKETKGLANVFVYLLRAPKSVHADEKDPAKVSLVLDNKACRFVPHAMVVRVGQTVEVINSDPVGHNTHTYPLKNQPKNVLIAANTPLGKGEAFDGQTVAELLPTKVACDFHTWMTAYWVVLDHPYAAVTDEKGNFTIPNLPAGKHEFRVWHERCGYVERKYNVTVKKGDNALPPLQVSVDKLKAK